MDPELVAFQNAIEAVDIKKAIEIADKYIHDNPDKFTEFQTIVDSAENESQAREKIVAAIDSLRDTLPIQHHLAEIFHLNRWHPMNIGGESQPTVRTEQLAKIQPTVRTAAHKAAKK